MNQLRIVSKDGKLLIDSREVAEMIEKSHAHLLRDIKGYVEIMSNSENPELDSLDFFVPSTYKVRGNNKTYDCYLLTKIGCDMVANKMSGEKGILFTATYVSRFEEMEKKSKLGFILPQNYKEALIALVGQVEVNEKLEEEKILLEEKISEYEPKITYLDKILTSKGTITITQIAKDYGLSGTALNKILHEEKIQYKVNKQWVLYTKYTNKGLTQSETIDITRSNGDPDVTMNTRWTQKGRLFIHEILTKRGIIPFMDRESMGA
ncbi:phage antirepressor KilAC domain-containing protein [Paenibacillus sp. FSL R7-0333]|uniref:phage antirepressor KilAC domain-containing protein n=1 Tax=Paenibacillus sp. FSL R7-0333 TaxID=1926587 RepID=UPI00096DA4BE|nr:Rha family transcriptional regulator [Paenibacillus sp. FSL R7-0333]